MRCMGICVFWLMAFPSEGEARTFHNSYLSFELPDQWQCQMRKKAYLCRHRVAKSCRANPKTPECQKQIKKSREAMIVLTAKEKSQLDTLAAFQEHFGSSKKFDASGGSTQSKVIHNKKVSINKLPWVDGMHLGSELPHYYTRYLASINGEVAVLISFSAHKLFYTNYSNQFFEGIKSLKITANQLNKVNSKELGQKILSRPIDIPDDYFDAPNIPDQTPSGGSSTVMFLLSLLLAAAGAFIWFKNKKS